MPELKIKTRFEIGQTVFSVSVSSQSQNKCSQCGGWDFRQAKNIFHIYEGKVKAISILYRGLDTYEIGYEVRNNDSIYSNDLFETRELAEQYIKDRLKEME